MVASRLSPSLSSCLLPSVGNYTASNTDLLFATLSFVVTASLIHSDVTSYRSECRVPKLCLHTIPNSVRPWRCVSCFKLFSARSSCTQLLITPPRGTAVGLSLLPSQFKVLKLCVWLRQKKKLAKFTGYTTSLFTIVTLVSLNIL
jgi:hypothetical protein